MSGEASAEEAEPVPATSCHFFGEGGAFLVLSGPCSEVYLQVAGELLEARLTRLISSGAPDWIDFQVGWADALELAHRELADDLSRRDLPPDTDLAISCTVLVLTGEQYYLAHLGRGRPMLYRAKFLQQLGKEHTEAFAALGKGEIKSSELPAHPDSRRLTRGLGIAEDDPMMATAAAFKKGASQPGDRFLVPAGELLAFVTEEQLLQALEHGEAPVDACADLVSAAREAGAPGAGCLMAEVREGAGPRWGAADEGDPIPAPPPARPKPQPVVAEPEPEEAAATPASPSGENPLDDIPTMPPPPPGVLAALGGMPDPDPLPDVDEAPPPPPMPPELARMLGTGGPEPASEPPPRSAPASVAPAPAPARPRPSARPAVDLPEPDRWIDIERTSRLDTTFAVGASLLASILLLVGLFWGSLF